MKVVVDFATYASIIEFKPFMGSDIELYQQAFENWYYEEVPCGGGKNLRQRSDLKYSIFDVNVVIDWIKETEPEANPIVLVERIDPDKVDSSLPGMYF